MKKLTLFLLSCLALLALGPASRACHRGMAFRSYGSYYVPPVVVPSAPVYTQPTCTYTQQLVLIPPPVTVQQTVVQQAPAVLTPPQTYTAPSPASYQQTYTAPAPATYQQSYAPAPCGPALATAPVYDVGTSYAPGVGCSTYGAFDRAFTTPAYAADVGFFRDDRVRRLHLPPVPHLPPVRLPRAGVGAFAGVGPVVLPPVGLGRAVGASRTTTTTTTRTKSFSRF